jgi:uncharacterized protein (TIGR03435 family)
MLVRRGREFSAGVSAGRVAWSAGVLLAFAAAGSFGPRWIALGQPARGRFEVASVKPSDASISGAVPVSILFQPGGRFTATNATLRFLIREAYDVQDNQVSGGPNWLNSDLYNIEARPDGATQVPPGPAGGAIMRPMIQSLLEERFKLAVHREIREMPVYDLSVARGGTKLKPADAKAGPGGETVGRGEISGKAAPVALLVKPLSRQLGRPVVDKTGLGGLYDFVLRWTPDMGQSAGPDVPPPDATGPSVFTALQEQLGLELRSARGRVEVLVIDHAEKPTEN